MTQKEKVNGGWDLLRDGIAFGLTFFSNKNKMLRLFEKFYNQESKTFNFTQIKENFNLLRRMMKSYFKGNYKNVSPWLFVHTAIGLAYFTLDIDLIPNNIPVLGVVDELAVLAWIVNSYADEIEKYKNWEAGQTISNIEIV